ncbi:NAD kinase [Propionibacterium freudenreichii]|uniref:NAD kinase n=1 Tax=Propionibacterium freudenreichii TaxID=1744 RepID=UPI0035D020CF
MLRRIARLEDVNQSRRVAITMHPVRTEALDGAAEFIAGMNLHGIECVVEESRVAEMRRRLPDVRIAALSNDSQVELMVVFGGDGTILRSAEWALPHRVPLLGVNLGHVGFLAELEASQIDELIAQVADRDYEIEKRLTLAVTVRDGDGRTVWESFAVNEVSTEKASREKMVDLLVTIDERPLSRWGCDGVLVASASGSTAYAFSCGGPVMWPNTEAFEVVPIAAHALFSAACVVAPTSTVDLRMVGDMSLGAVVWCDGRRSVDVHAGYGIGVHRNPDDLQIARLREQPFTTRLVKKFGLNIDGWRSPGLQRPTPEPC